MEQFTVPQFIEHEPKIVGPLTFKQFIFVGIAGAICFVLYFTIPFYIFLLATIVLMLGGFALAFVKVGGQTLPNILKNFFVFSLSPKIYLWKKKEVGLPPKIIKVKKVAPKEEKKASVPMVVGQSHLKELSTQVETKIRE
jgi:hypothetical protein